MLSLPQYNGKGSHTNPQIRRAGRRTAESQAVAGADGTLGERGGRAAVLDAAGGRQPGNNRTCLLRPVQTIGCKLDGTGTRTDGGQPIPWYPYPGTCFADGGH